MSTRLFEILKPEFTKVKKVKKLYLGGNKFTKIERQTCEIMVITLSVFIHTSQGFTTFTKLLVLLSILGKVLFLLKHNNS